MNSRIIQLAIPTDDDALEYLKTTRDDGDVKVTAITAKTLYPDKIKSNKNFVCPTAGCTAPLTCRSIKEIHVNQPTFVDQSRVINLHTIDCKHHPDNRGKEEAKSRESESYASHFSSGRTISSLSRLNGFAPPTTYSTKNNVSGTSRVKSGNSLQADGEGEKSKKKKGVMHRLSTLQQHAELYVDDPDFRIINQSVGDAIPIREMFTGIEDNVLHADQHLKETLTIYTGRAYLAETRNELVIAVRFKNKVRVEGRGYRPSMIISREYFKEEYDDIYEAFINGEQYEFDVFTTLPFLLNDEYLNFSSYIVSKQINPFGDELYSNFYIR
ncbi:hypothetical protein ACFPFV_07995 [Salinicoccus siamensis]|uniref:Competence protein CoiA-like protein n=1 Tax=Salinicoccus siamensis TaxID=381830 RepID=A0ABV5Z282_9STAP